MSGRSKTFLIEENEIRESTSKTVLVESAWAILCVGNTTSSIVPKKLIPRTDPPDWSPGGTSRKKSLCGHF